MRKGGHWIAARVLNWLCFGGTRVNKTRGYPGGGWNITGRDYDCKFHAELQSQRTRGCKGRIMASAALITFGGPGIETDKDKDNMLELTGRADYPVPSKMVGQACDSSAVRLPRGLNSGDTTMSDQCRKLEKGYREKKRRESRRVCTRWGGQMEELRVWSPFSSKSITHPWLAFIKWEWIWHISVCSE